MADGLSIGNLSVSGGLTRLIGTSSKLDTEAIVAAAYEAKRLPAVRLEQRISRNEARGAALGELKTLLQNLKDGVAGLRNPPGLLGANENVFETKQAFLSGGGAVPAGELVGVSVANRAAAGGFSLEVVRLATAHKLAAQPLGAVGQTLADAWNGGAAFAGTLEIGLAGGVKAAIAVDGAMSADDLRAAINAVSAQTGVSASVLSVSATDRRLVLSATETGRSIELADAGGDAVAALLAATPLQAAQTALISVDGVPIERAGNRIDDVLPGVTIDLYQADPGAEADGQDRAIPGRGQGAAGRVRRRLQRASRLRGAPFDGGCRRPGRRGRGAVRRPDLASTGPGPGRVGGRGRARAGTRGAEHPARCRHQPRGRRPAADRRGHPRLASPDKARGRARRVRVHCDRELGRPCRLCADQRPVRSRLHRGGHRRRRRRQGGGRHAGRRAGDRRRQHDRGCARHRL